MIITAPLSVARHIECDQKWLITRQPQTIEGIRWVPELAPSKQLFARYMKEWKGKRPEEYWSMYVEAFERELKTEEKLEALRELWKLSSQGLTVALLCYCPKPEYCHRSLVGNFLRSFGVTVEEHVPKQAVIFE